jgi:hypothetical protein
VTPAEIAASFEQLSRSGATSEERVKWLAALTQPQPQQGPQRVSEQAYQEMDATEKYAYARQFTRE